MTDNNPSSSNLQSVNQEQAQTDLPLQIDQEVKEVQNPVLVKQADDIVANLLKIDPTDLAAQDREHHSLANLGQGIELQMKRHAKILSEPMKSLVADAEDGGLVGSSLMSLQEQVNIINPSKMNFTMGTVRRLLAKIPGVGTPMSRWFQEYQTVGQVINDIVVQLKEGKAQLKSDNEVLRQEQIRMIGLTKQLKEYANLGQIIAHKLQAEIAQLSPDDARKKFLEEEILFPINQRIIGIQQQLATNQIGAVASEVIVRNNRELIKGVDNALNVTITALETAAVLQVALKRQERTLSAVQSVNDTTNEILASTAKTIKTQGVEIQKQASSTQLDMEVLKSSFADVVIAMEDISTFRREALPHMASSIKQMDEMTKQMEVEIQKLEDGNQMQDEIVIDFKPEE